MLKYILSLLAATAASSFNNQTHAVIPAESANNCIQFSVAAGTGCAWMCSYCANTLGTSNYYFTDGVCTYESGGCVGNPIAGTTYTCCAL